MINEGKATDEIQSDLNILSRHSLKQHIVKIINDDMKFYEVSGRYGRGAMRRPMIYFKGELRLMEHPMMVIRARISKMSAFSPLEKAHS